MNPSRVRGLPASTTSLVGREQECAAVAQLLRAPGVRLLTLTGPGGVGKTRLAHEVATRVAGEFGDGARYVPLAPLGDPGLVLDAIGSVLEIHEQGGESRLEQLQSALWSRRLLLVLDNFEHVADAGPLLARLLAECPLVKALATSRARLRLSIEQEFVVRPLALSPAEGADDAAAAPPAVELFVERARAVRNDFRLTETNAAAVGEICRRLDGLPLAIELAAVRTNLLSPDELLARLDHPLEVLTGGPGDLPARHRELRSTIAWSYELLDPDEQATFRALGVFAGSCSLSSAEAVCGADGGRPVLDRLGSLVDSGLVRRSDAGNESRLEMLETIREFAAEKLVQHGEEDDRRAAHACHFVTVAETSAVELTGHRQMEVLERLGLDYANLRAAVQWHLDHRNGESALKICNARWRAGFWLARPHLREGRGWLVQALDRYGPQETTLRAAALATLGTLSFLLGDFDAAEASSVEGLEVSRRLGDHASIVETSVCRGRIFRESGATDRARPLILEALDAARHAGEGELALARQQLGFIAVWEESFDEARGLLEESLAMLEQRGDRLNAVLNLLALSYAVSSIGDEDEASRLAERAFALSLELGEPWRISVTLLAFARIALAESRPEAGVQLLGLAERTRDETAADWVLFDRMEFDRNLARGRDELSEEAFAAAWATGQTLTLEQARALFVDHGPPPRVFGTGPLTAREHQVLELIAKGLTDAEVAKELVVSPRTVHAHLRSVYRKLGVSSRAEATRVALVRELPE